MTKFKQNYQIQVQIRLVKYYEIQIRSKSIKKLQIHKINIQFHFHLCWQVPVLFRIRIFGVRSEWIMSFFGCGVGLDFIFAQAGSGPGLSKTFWTLFNFFAFCFFPAKILLIAWEFRCWMMLFILFFNLSRMVDFHTAVVRWCELHVLKSPLAMAIACIVRHVNCK